MADERIKQYWSKEMDALLATYRQFEELVPAGGGVAGAAHRGEDGRYVEYLIREYLTRYLPKDLEVLTGFILRPAVKGAKGAAARGKDEHEASGQLDIIVYDTAHYPVYQRFGDSVIVLPEGVTAVLSVKKHLRIGDIEHEIEMLGKAGSLCVHNRGDGTKARSPFTALITMEDKIGENNKVELTPEQKGKKSFQELQKFYQGKTPLYYDEMVDFVGSLSQWGIYKERLSDKQETGYLFFEYDKKDRSTGFQLILQNILSVYYENTSQLISRPGFADNSGKGYKDKWGSIPYHCAQISRK